MPTKWALPTEKSRRLFEKQKAFLQDLCERLDAANDFPFDDWEILFHLLENYNPSLILEVGRGAGNTTCVFLDYCHRHSHARLISVDLYDNWHQHSAGLLPQAILEKAEPHALLHQDFADFNCHTVTGGQWDKLFIFWDLSDRDATERLVSKMLPPLANRDVIVAVHDVGLNTGRPQRFHWREYESLYPDLEIIGRFVDKVGWFAAAVPVEQIFGQFRNAGHWLMIGPLRGQE